ncbi:MAG: ribonuclease HII [Ruminococcaceae bacterium]|nr:ribonuclease HII [Oscillospiraceae bacterium]
MVGYELERAYKEKGYKCICGTDEAGRGPLAGPVFAAAVILPDGLVIEGLDDSKKLSEKKREKLFDEIIEKAEAYAVASADEKEIDKLNILNAAQLAMRRAVEALGKEVDLVLVDGNVARDFPMDAVPVIKGDAISASIAAASVLAKVSRDRVCTDMDAEYPMYGFLKHKGYPTKEHYEAIKEYGPCPLHRRSFRLYK